MFSLRKENQADIAKYRGIAECATDWWFPTPITSEVLHLGIDLGLATPYFESMTGVAVKSISEGTIVGLISGLGDEPTHTYSRVAIEHRLNDGKGVIVLYAHIEPAEGLAVGAAVASNQEIGKIGKHGGFPHLHLSLCSMGDEKLGDATFDDTDLPEVYDDPSSWDRSNERFSLLRVRVSVFFETPSRWDRSHKLMPLPEEESVSGRSSACGGRWTGREATASP